MVWASRCCRIKEQAIVGRKRQKIHEIASDSLSTKSTKVHRVDSDAVHDTCQKN